MNVFFSKLDFHKYHISWVNAPVIILVHIQLDKWVSVLLVGYGAILQCPSFSSHCTLERKWDCTMKMLWNNICFFFFFMRKETLLTGNRAARTDCASVVQQAYLVGTWFHSQHEENATIQNNHSLPLD